MVPPNTPMPTTSSTQGEPEPDVERPTLVPEFDPEAFARESDADGDRPTVVPDYDPEAFARDSEVKQRAALPVTGESTIDEARRLLQQGAPEEALFLVARLLEHSPFHSEATALLKECRDALERECLSAIGSPSAILVVALRPDELRGFALDSASGFLLSLLDGATTVETLVDLSGLPRLLALRHLRGLVARGLVVAQRNDSRR